MKDSTDEAKPGKGCVDNEGRRHGPYWDWNEGSRAYYRHGVRHGPAFLLSTVTAGEQNIFLYENGARTGYIGHQLDGPVLAWSTLPDGMDVKLRERQDPNTFPLVLLKRGDEEAYLNTYPGSEIWRGLLQDDPGALDQAIELARQPPAEPASQGCGLGPP